MKNCPKEILKILKSIPKEGKFDEDLCEKYLASGNIEERAEILQEMFIQQKNTETVSEWSENEPFLQFQVSN